MQIHTIHSNISGWFRIDAVQSHHITLQPQVPYKPMMMYVRKEIFLFLRFTICLYGTSGCKVTRCGCTASILNEALVINIDGLLVIVILCISDFVPHKVLAKDYMTSSPPPHEKEEEEK